MGGGSTSFTLCKPKVCQLYKEVGHEAPLCKYKSVPCNRARCNGRMEVMFGINLEQTRETKLLKCEIDSCSGNETIYMDKDVGDKYLKKGECGCGADCECECVCGKFKSKVINGFKDPNCTSKRS
ncbi:hypothetical protein ACHQM5_001771 [Ranunculus cassubicifolius]